MKIYHKIILTFLFLCLAVVPAFSQQKVKVVTTLSTYADIAQYIGQDKVEVKYIVGGDQDAHYVKPKPSYAVWLSQADLFVETGLDLELWVPALLDKAGNRRIRSGQLGYVAVAEGIRMLEVPATASRAQGDVHVYGNPHVHTSPLNAKIIAENITIGLSRVDPDNAEFYRSRLEAFKREIDVRLFGEKLVTLLGGEVLTRMAESHQLIPFLEEKNFKNQKLIELLGGWMQQMFPLRGRKLVAYHKNWAYFEDLFELKIIGYVEPKPGIPPSPKDLEMLIQKMRQEQVKVILAANYFDEQKIKAVAEKVGATPVIVPLGVGGIPEVQNYFQLIDYWVTHLRQAFLAAE